MLKEERQSMILEIINVRNKIRSTELSEHLNVSEDTIRRDLRELADGGFIKKVHGGALANPKTPEALLGLSGGPSEEIRHLAIKAFSLIKPGQVIILDGGATTEHLVTLLEEDMPLTIFTNSIVAANRLAELPTIDTFLLGGKMAGRSRITCGMDVIKMLRDIRADLCFLDISSIHEEIGLTANNRDVSMTKKAMLESANQAIGLCPSEQIGRIQPFRIVGVEALDLLVTEITEGTKAIHSLKQKGVRFL